MSLYSEMHDGFNDGMKICNECNFVFEELNDGLCDECKELVDCA
jgi:hypothetical protein